MNTATAQPDITSTHLEAAILDQKVAGVFRGKRYAFAVVTTDGKEDTGMWALGVAVQGEQGYNPIEGKTFDVHGDAQQWADGLNKHIGHTPRDVIEIITTTMQGTPRPGLDTWTR